MSEFSLGNSTTYQLPSLLLSDFMLFCSFILSHPLYFSYFIFFSPYLLKIFSFLSPLFVTTTLLLLAFFTLTPTFVNQAASNCHLDFPESKDSFLLTTYQTLVQTLRSSKADEDESDVGFGCLEELEAYKIVFETSTTLEISESPDEFFDMDQSKLEDCSEAVEAETKIMTSSATTTTSTEKSAQITRPETNQVKAVVKIFEDFLQEKDGVENLSSKKREKEVKSVSVEPNKGDVEEQQKESKAILGNKISEYPKAISADNSQRGRANWSSENENETMGSNSLGNFGSMRKEKEWKRTLACKLFEERHNGDNIGGEGMDLLWETYETTDSNKAVNLKSGSKKGKKLGGSDYYCDIDEDDYEEEESNAQLCCLQALKFSAGKMNLGMGRPNLVKISKALKGIGWLHHVSSSSRHGKKGYH